MATILVVDDDAALRTQLGQHLHVAGHRVVLESDGARALTVLEQQEIDLLLLDVMLPKLSGFEVCRRVRANPLLYKLPVMIMSAMGGDEEVQHGLAQGAEDYVVKPFQFANLLQRLETLLAAHAENRMLDESVGLPGPNFIKLEFHRAMTTRQPFSAVYAELVNLRAFLQATGADARARALRHFARGLRLVGEEMRDDTFRCGHLGGGHFVCLVPQDKSDAYCRQFLRLWENHLPSLYEAVGLKELPSSNGHRSSPSLTALLCVASWEPGRRIGMTELFETLSRLRENANSQPGTSIFVDRRN